MKSIAVLFILSCLSLSFVNSMNVTTWGKVGTRVLGEKTVHIDRFTGYPTIHAFAFPSDNSKRVAITGIKHINFSNDPVKVTFIDGDINSKEIAILLESRVSRGLNSRFIFYGM